MHITHLRHYFLSDTRAPEAQRPHPEASSQHPPTTSRKHLRWLGVAPSHPGWVCCRQPLLCCSSTASTPQSAPAQPRPSPPRPSQGSLHLGYRLRLTCNELGRMDVVPGGTRAGPDAHWGVVSSAHPPPAPLAPPDQRTRPQTSTGAVTWRPEQLAMVPQCPWHLPSPSATLPWLSGCWLIVPARGVVPPAALHRPETTISLGGRPVGWRLLASRGAGEAGTSCSPSWSPRTTHHPAAHLPTPAAGGAFRRFEGMVSDACT